MSLNDRIGRLEGVTPPIGCATCQGWTHRLEMPGDVISPYEAEHRRWLVERYGPGPREWPAVCPHCRREIPTVVLAHLEGEPPAPGSLLATWLRQEDEQ